jgi:hypothetical protein
LGDAMNYYDLELAKVSDAGIAGTEAVASEVLAWRAENYVPLSAQVANVILWSGNQNLFGVANTRLTQTGAVVNFLEGAAPNPSLQDSYANAQVLMQTANEENEAAKNALLESLSPDQSLALITQSLQDLSKAYKQFSDINTTVQTLLPINSGQ